MSWGPYGRYASVEKIAPAPAPTPRGPSVEERVARLALREAEADLREAWAIRQETYLRELQERAAAAIAATTNQARRYESIAERMAALLAVAIARMERGSSDVVARAGAGSGRRQGEVPAGPRSDRAGPATAHGGAGAAS